MEQVTGLLVAQNAFGPQDKYFSEESKFDGKKLLLKDPYKTVYGKLAVNCKVFGESGLLFKVERQCDLINLVDLVIPSKFPINTLIKKIDVYFGGQRMDVLYVTEDIETQIRTNAAIFNRTLSTIGDKTFIPLAMAPFHANNVVFPSSLHHELTISVDLGKQFNPEEIKEDIELYAHKYTVSNRNEFFTEPHEFITIQNQYTGVDQIKKGVNEIKLSYNHPVYLIYLWGFDKSKVTNVRLLVNTAVLIDASVAVLEHQKACRGFGHVEPLMLFLSDKNPGEHTFSTVNFSRIDSSWIEITTEQESANVHCVGLNIQPLRYSQGLVGLAFSK